MFFSPKKKSLPQLIDQCKRRHPASQKELFDRFAGYAMAICQRYAANDWEAEEMVSDGFLKVFQNLDRYNPDLPFESWFKRVVINCAIDYFRKHQPKATFSSLEGVEEKEMAIDTEGSARFSEEELLEMVQELSPAYRLVFSLSVIDGYSHEEISQQLNITESAVRANLTKAKAKLRERMSRPISNSHGQSIGHINPYYGKSI